MVELISHLIPNMLGFFQAGDLRIAGLPSSTEVNPYVKAFLVPGRTFKYRTKTINKSRVSEIISLENCLTHVRGPFSVVGAT